jgi:hypothetical protein
MTEILSIIAISVIFLSGIIPLVMGIVYYARENRRLDREEKERTA